MNKQPTEPLERATEQSDDDGMAGCEDGDLETGTWKSIGDLANAILSVAKARKAPDGTERDRQGQLSNGAWEETIGWGEKIGGAEGSVPARCLPVAKAQRTPAAEVSLGSKDRARRRSASL